MSADYLAKLSTGFYEPLKKNIVTMESLKKKVKIGDANVYDIEQLYARMLVISQNRDIRLSDLFKYELSSVPSSLFDDFGDLRKGTKANMLHKLAAFSNGQKIQVDVLIVDSNGALYHTLWPKSTTPSKFAARFVDSLARPYDTVVIFDRYHQNSIKAHERQRIAVEIADLDRLTPVIKGLCPPCLSTERRYNPASERGYHEV